MEWPLLAGLAGEDRQEILARMRTNSYSRGVVLFHEGDPGGSLHMVAKGRLMARVSNPEGEESVLSVMGPGEVVGEMSLLGQELRRTASIVAVEPTETLSLDRGQLGVLRTTHPAFDRFLIEVLVDRVNRLTGRVLEAHHASAEVRVLRRVFELAAIYGGGNPVDIPLTQDDVAAMAGTTRPTVNRILRNAEGSGILQLARGRITVIDSAALSRVAEL